MPFTQKTFPEDFIKSAKKLEDSYFLEHVNQVDYFKKGYTAIPTLFKFCFDKKVYEKMFLTIDEQLEKAELTLIMSENKKTDIEGDVSLSAEIKEELLSQVKEEIESINNSISGIKSLILFRDSNFTTFDLNTSMEGISAFIYHDSEEHKSKPINSFIYKFFDFEKERTDYTSIISKGTISEFIQSFMERGFSYDKENCLFGKVVEIEGIEYKNISDEEIKRLNTIDEISNFVVSNNYDEYVDYVSENNIDTIKIFNEKTILAYSIAMDKNDFALNCIFSNKEVTLNTENKINDVIDQIIYSIVYRNHKVEDYLSTVIERINFDNKDQEYINEFVKKTFIEFKKKLSKDIFLLYKDKIDNKKLSLALLKDCNVYRLEESTMDKYIKEAFKKYPKEIMEVENILSHFNYYKKTMSMIENLKNTPDILINGLNFSHYILSLMKEVENKIELIEDSEEVKYDYWEDSTELLTELEFLNQKLLNIKETLTLLGISFTDKIRNTLPAHYVFSIYEDTNLSTRDGLSGHIVYITPLDFWNANGYMFDEPNEIPATMLPIEWNAEDINESGTWFINTDLSAQEVIDKMIEIGFVQDTEFCEFISPKD